MQGHATLFGKIYFLKFYLFIKRHERQNVKSICIYVAQTVNCKHGKNDQDFESIYFTKAYL